MPRLMLSDKNWSKLKAIFRKIKIYNKPNLRLFIEAVLFRIRVGCPWRDLPEEFGLWNSVYKRFNTWSKQGKWLALFNAMVKEPDLEWVFIDATFIKAHQHSTGAASSHDEGIGKSVGGNTTKIHLSVDSYGYPVCFEITGGNVHDIRAAHDTLPKQEGIEAVVTDTAYGSGKFRTQIETIGAKAVIPRKKIH